ncbi:MAG: LuxR C-terminal-related transcriptional regulator [Litorivicinus sp.]
MHKQPVVLICSCDERASRLWQQTLDPIASVQLCQQTHQVSEILRFCVPDLILFHIDGRVHHIDHALTVVMEQEDIKTLVLDEHPTDSDGVVLVKAGVRGYANASMEGRLLQTAITTICSGDIWVARRIMQTLVNELLNDNTQDAGYMHPSLSLLTERELEIAELVAEGSSNKIVATRLGITERTVKAHLTSAFNKTGARGRLDLSLMVKGEFRPQIQQF